MSKFRWDQREREVSTDRFDMTTKTEKYDVLQVRKFGVWVDVPHRNIPSKKIKDPYDDGLF